MHWTRDSGSVSIEHHWPAPVMRIVGHCGRYEANRSIALEFVDSGFVRRCEFQPSRFFIFCTVDHCGFGVHDLRGTLPAPTSAAWMPLHHGCYYSGHACCGTSIFDEEIVYDAQQRASLDAAVAFCLDSEAHLRRASEPERWAASSVTVAGLFCLNGAARLEAGSCLCKRP